MDEGKDVGFLSSVALNLLFSIENAMLAGSAINQDGRSSALTAPHGPSQKLLLLDVAREEAATSVHGISDAATSTKYIATPRDRY